MNFKKLMLGSFLAIGSMNAYCDDDYCSVKSTLSEMMYKGTVQQAQRKLGQCNAWYKSTSRKTSHSMGDGKIVDVRTYGPDNPWLILYSVDEIIIGFTILNN